MNIIGRVTADAKVSTLKDQRQVVNFSVAVNDRYKNKQGEQVELTEYFNCAYWVATGVAKALTKGALVELTGRVSASVWKDKDGKAHASLNFHTSQIKLHGGGQKTTTAQAVSTTQNLVNMQTQNTLEDLPF